MRKGYPPEEYEPWRDYYGKAVPKRIAIPKDIKPDMMLRLVVAATVAFPDRSMSVGALRRAGVAKRLRVYRIAGKDFTTLNDIELMMKETATCHVQQSPLVSGSAPPVVIEPQSSSFSIEGRKLALAAARATLQGLSEPLESISKANTTRPTQSAKVIPIKS